jgi:phosphatidylglycerophosphate synthase
VKRAGPRGELVDLLCDQAGPVAVALLLLAHGAAPPLLAAVYLTEYLMLIGLVTAQNAAGIPVQPVFRSRFFLFAAAALWTIWGINWTGHLMLVCCIQMPVFCAWSVTRLRRWLPEIRSADAPPSPPARPSVKGDLLAFWLICLLPLAVLPWAGPVLAWFWKPV